MKAFLFPALCAGLMAAAAALAQQPAELPSAPSATLAPPVQGKAPAPAPPQVKAAPAPPAATADPGAKPQAGPASGQAEAENQDDIPTIVKVVNEVNVVFTVTDKHGRFVKDLKQDDFRVMDDYQLPKQIKLFSRETNLPLRVGLLVDASNSVRDRFRFEQDAAIEFLGQIVRPGSDRAFVLGFDTSAELTADFTDNTEILSRGVRMLRPGGGTALYDAVYYACRDKLMKAPQTGPVRRAIVLLSDGDDNQSRVTREDAIAMAQRAEVIVYAISTNASGYKERGDRVMERMADSTGGRAFFPLRIEDVATAFSEIQEELRSQYAVAYSPANFNRDGHFRAIDITVPNRKDLKVRARKGYYAPSQ
jgi:VWFA-related protein